jgi:hypothetical protein
MHENVIHDRFQRILESINLIKERIGNVAKAKDPPLGVDCVYVRLFLELKLPNKD